MLREIELVGGENPALPATATVALIGYVGVRLMQLMAAGLSREAAADWGEAFQVGWDAEFTRYIAARQAGLGAVTAAVQ